MNSRPLLDYLMDPIDDMPRQPQDIDPAGSVSALQARLRELEAHLNARPAPVPVPMPQPAAQPDLTLSAQIEAILSRKAAIQAPIRTTYEEVPRPRLPELRQEPTRVPRVVVEPPPIVTAQPQEPKATIDADFVKFSEAVYLIGQAAKRFIEQPQSHQQQPQPQQIQPVAAPIVQSTPAAPSTVEIDALSAMLRETVNAFRNVADDLAVSAAEMRRHATHEPVPQPQPQPQVRYTARRPETSRDEIAELRETMDELQDRLDGLTRRRRHARY